MRWNHTEEEIRSILGEELDEMYGIGISFEEKYLSVTIDYDDEPGFIGKTIDDLFEGDYELRASIDPSRGQSSYVVELKDDS